MEQKRLFLAMALSLLVLLLFRGTSNPKKQSGNTLTSGKNEIKTEQLVQQKGVMPHEKFQILPKSEKKEIINVGNYELTTTNYGGAITNLAIISKEAENKTLLKADKETPAIFLLKSDLLESLGTNLYSIQKHDEEIELFTETAEKVNIIKRIKASKENLVLSIVMTNTTAKEKTFEYTIIGPAGIQEIGAVKGRSFIQADVDIDGIMEKKNSVKETWSKAGQINWIALKNRYYAAILKPYSSAKTASIKGSKKEALYTEIKMTKQTLLPGQTIQNDFLFYCGPMNEKQLKEYGYGFEKLVDYGWFSAISKVLLTVLRVYYKVAHNWGIAIILLTFTVNIISFPLTKKSFSSMQQMKEIQPHMQKLKDLHKDNPQKLNKEMMELYKKYNVNPFGGCLPMLLQIPIFIALYQGLIRAIELNGASFLWIANLAKPDAVHIPFSLPALGNSINILPILMVVVMALQQKIQGNAASAMTDEQASQQKMMMVMMPVLFGFIFYNMPSGLVLYWLTNTMLMTLEQATLRKKSA